MKHYKTYKLRRKIVFKNLSAWWWNYVYLTGGISRFVTKYKHAVTITNEMPTAAHSACRR